MDFSTQSKKRTADDLYEDNSSAMETDPSQLHPQNSLTILSAPRVLSRRHHRLKHIATEALHANPTSANTISPPKPPFNIFKALVRHPNLFFEFTLRLPLRTLVDLYAIDKEFHWRFNKYATSILHDWVKRHCREAAEIASWAMYARFSISDPELKPRDDKKYLARDAPSLRWVKMVVHRDGCVRRLLTYMALDGHRVPRRTARVLHKYWLLVELKSSEAREKYIRDREYWSDTDILVFHLFLTKLDMHFSDPVHGQGVCALSELLLTQPTLTYLCNLVAGRAKVNYDHLADMVTWTYPNEDLDIEQHPWLDDELTVQPDRWGILTSENWEVGGEYMATPLDLLALEAIRRRIPVNRFEIDFVVYGYTDPETGANLPFPRLRVERGRRVVGMLEVEEEVDEDGKRKVPTELRRVDVPL